MSSKNVIFFPLIGVKIAQSENHLILFLRINQTKKGIRAGFPSHLKKTHMLLLGKGILKGTFLEF